MHFELLLFPSSKGEISTLGECFDRERFESFGAFASCVEPFSSFWSNYLYFQLLCSNVFFIVG
jgi:hypothetical protein